MKDLKNWYAVYTRSKAEKSVSKLLKEDNITEYLPLVKTLRQWSDRKKYVTLPLFNSYIFVHITEIEKLRVLQCPGVVCFVTIGQELINIPENQINAIKEFVQNDYDLNINFEPVEGQKVKVNRGPMKGLEGVIVKKNGSHKLQVKIEAINQFITLTVPINLVDPISPKVIATANIS
ncbi:MAG: UpxY family transcription antiterminator [Bacteroidales bacterium]|nr:UpxY family transcription antiterminator [Bacteroidales bacterium]